MTKYERCYNRGFNGKETTAVDLKAREEVKADKIMTALYRLPADRTHTDDFARKVRHHKAQIDAAKFVIAEAEETIHESEYYLQVLRDEKAAALGADFNKIIGERTIEVNRGGFNSDRHVISKANPVFVDADYPGFKFRDAHGRQISDTYDLYYEHETAAQIETVIRMLKLAIERGDTELTFPTVEELNGK